MIPTELKLLPPPEKKVVAKVLYDMRWSSRKIGKLLEISKDSVLRSCDEPTPDSLSQFETDFRLIVNETKKEGLALVLQQILDRIPKEKRLDILVKVAEYLEGSDSARPGVSVQVNSLVANIPDALSKKYDAS